MRHALPGSVRMLLCILLPLATIDRLVSAEAQVAATRDLGAYTRHVTTISPDAQTAFDRGLILSYSFHHSAAEKEFRRAAALDPMCAMAWWGVALVNGPHINFPMVPPDKAKIAWAALTKARERAAGASDVERAFIEALGARYADPQPKDRHPLDVAYANAMRKLWQDHPDDADAGALFAEAMMDLRPWDLWKPDSSPQPGTLEIRRTLEAVLALDANHPGANHFLIHTLEASSFAKDAEAAADRLANLVPGAGHMVHMPAHIYARVGRWDDAIDANARAIMVDAKFDRGSRNPGIYAMYMAHNQHFYAFAAMMEGRSAAAIRAANEMIAGVPPAFVKQYGPIVDGYMAFVPEALMRFGKWDEVLRVPAPPRSLPLATALWRYCRAASLVALGRRSEAQTERARFAAAARAVPADLSFGNNASSQLLAIASKMLDGEMAAKRGRLAQAIALLKQAVVVEDRLRYDEPPDWMQPVRHTLGIVQLQAHRYADAEATYRADLKRYPENGWSLFGLARALRLQHKDADAAQVGQRFKRIWAHADFPLRSTCLCLSGV